MAGVAQEELEEIKAALMLLDGRMEALRNRVLFLSQALAEKEHGAEAVRAAAEAAGDLLPRFANDWHPYDSLMDWHKQKAAH
jgi:prefoldin subunit 5